MASLTQTQQETRLTNLRGINAINPSIHPNWSFMDWFYYLVTFPLEYALIFLFVVPSTFLSFFTGFCFNFLRYLSNTRHSFTANHPKDNLKQKRVLNGFNLHKTTNNEIVSIIIPCYNESKTIESTLIYLDLNCLHRNQIEIILVDGNSPDVDTLRAVVKETKSNYLNIKSEQIRVISKENITGRGTCQNIGAACANGKYLFFMHADTVPPEHYDEIIRNSFAHKQNVLLGAFTFGVDRSLMQYPLPGLGWMEFFARMRNKWLYLPWGDQGLWMKRERFVDIGGFGWIPILDDVEFVLRCNEIAKVQNQIIYIDDHVAWCSPRRWMINGVAKNTVLTQWVLFLYVHLKLTPQRVYEIYYGRKI